MSAYLQEFKSDNDIEEQFEIKLEPGTEVLLAWYGYGSYCGEALVIFRKDGKLFEVNANHCSCFALEGQWKPEETTLDALRMRDLTASAYSCGGEQKALTALGALLESLKEVIDDTPQVEEAFTLWCKSKFGDEFEFFNSDPKSSPFFAAFLAGWQARESKVSK